MGVCVLHCLTTVLQNLALLADRQVDLKWELQAAARAAAACNIVLLVLVNLDNEKRSDQPCWTCSADTAPADR